MPNSGAVLIVEDDASTQGLLVAVVRRLGMRAKTADDGGAALAMIATEPPAAIILDLIMPGVDGFEVLRQLRHGSSGLLARTIVITAGTARVGDHPDLDLVWKFFRKPLDIQLLGMSVFDCVHASAKKAGRDGAYETPPQL
jgi:DNA-binding response OmpR family regulator